MKFTRLSLVALIALQLALTGCASLNSTRAPGADLSRIKSIYVQKLEGEDADIDKLMVKRLTAMGYEATTGAAEKPAQSVDATITYVDRWMWDITMYLLRLTVQVRDGASGAIIASAESYRPSLQRKSPEAMVDEVLDEVFRKAK